VPFQAENFDRVVSNPPYIARASAGELPPELAHEPETALFGGDDGLDIVRRLIDGVGSALVPGGVLAVEIDPAQAEVVQACCVDAGLEQIQLVRDLAKRVRVVRARVPGGVAAQRDSSRELE
jgi:release factor glutamine methyltransferase